MALLSLIPKSSIARKQFVAITGLLLLGFVFSHLAGNFIIFKGAQAFNGYAHGLQELQPVLNLLRAGLFAIFASHVVITITLVKENKQARKNKYVVNKNIGDRKTSSSTMPYTGVAVLLFIILHLCDFTFKIFPAPEVISQDSGVYGLIFNSFKSPTHSILYICTMIALGLHLSHALQSVFRTLGLFNEKYMPLIEKVSFITGWLVALAYSSIPLSILLGILKDKL